MMTRTEICRALAAIEHEARQYPIRMGGARVLDHFIMVKLVRRPNGDAARYYLKEKLISIARLVALLETEARRRRRAPIGFVDERTARLLAEGQAVRTRISPVQTDDAQIPIRMS